MSRDVSTSRRSLCALLLLATLATTRSAYGNNDGRQTGRFASGCAGGSSCHGMDPGATVTLTGPTMLAAGTRGTYTLTVASSLSTFMAAGIDVSLAGTPGASLATVSPNTQLRNGDITHTGRIARTGANVQVQFALVAPSTPGMVTIQAVGNAVNGDTRSSGDSWARTTLAVAVTGGAVVDASMAADATVPRDVAVAPDAPRGDGAVEYEQYDPSASMAYGRCSTLLRARGQGGWMMVGGLVVLAAMRRRKVCARA
jgi:hypothetical protein